MGGRAYEATRAPVRSSRGAHVRRVGRRLGARLLDRAVDVPAGSGRGVHRVAARRTEAPGRAAPADPVLRRPLRPEGTRPGSLHRGRVALRPGGELPVSLFFRGKPAANVLVVAMSKDDPQKTVSARTDANGLVTLRIAHPGFWLVKAVHMESAPPDAGVDWESWWASVTFDLPAAR